MKFTTAHQVRKHLKDNGITEKFSVSWGDSPFSGGEGLFWVTFKELAGTLVYSSDNGGTHYGDNAESVGVLAKAKKLLEGTNAVVG